MVDNPTKIYNDYVRANLPNSMSYDTGTDRYDINSHSFFKFKNSNWYFNYISKYGYSALSAYAVNGFEPALVFDFKGNYFRKSATDSTFPASITHAATTNATMVDSDGLLKWRPHNLMTSSGDLSGTGWSGSMTRGAVTSGSPFGTYQTISPSASGGMGEAQRVQVGKTLTLGATYVGWALVKYSAGSGWFDINMYDTGDTTKRAYFDVQNGVVGVKDAANIDHGMVDYGDGWWLCWASANAASTSGGPLYEVPDGNGSQSTSTSDVILIAGTQFNRSDLGGMVNNPDTANSYVPTTTTPVYLSRRGHHIYNGSAWVNEGILHESESRTNLYLNSNQFVSPWNRVASDIYASAGTSPSGLADAWRWVGNGTSILYQVTPYAAGNNYTVSAWVKSNGAGEDTFRLYGLNNVMSGDFTATSEWVRYSFTFNSASAVNQFSGILYGASQGNVDLLVYGFQIEAGSTHSSYIPTAGASVTRAAETLTVPAANLPYPTYVETTGTELVTNGTFATDLSGWEGYNDTPLWDNGRLYITAPTAFDGARTTLDSIPTTTGKRYKLTWDVELGTLSSVKVDVYGVSSAAGLQGSLTVSATGSYTMYFTAGHSAANIYLLSGNAVGSAWFDNVSVKEVNPLALSIQIDGKMTYADSGAGLEVEYYRWQLNSINYIFSYLSTQTGRSGQPIFAQRQSASGYDDVKGGDFDYSPDTNVPFNRASRHGSTFINAAHEGTLLTVNTTPTALPDLSATDLLLGSTFMGTIGEFRMWSDDLGDVGITEATLPSTEPSLSLTFDGSETSFIVLDWSE